MEATMEDVIKLLNVEAQKQINHKENKIYSVKIMVQILLFEASEVEVNCIIKCMKLIN